MDAARREELMHRYAAAAHGMQSGVAMMMNHDAKATEPKHLRVGVNSAMSDAGALAKLLIAKGIFTEEEYLVAVCEGMEAERDTYTAKVKEAVYGKDAHVNVVLG